MAAVTTAPANTCPAFCVHVSSCLWDKRPSVACRARWYLRACFDRTLPTRCPERLCRFARPRFHVSVLPALGVVTVSHSAVSQAQVRADGSGRRSAALRCLRVDVFSRARSASARALQPDVYIFCPFSAWIACFVLMMFEGSLPFRV